MCFILFTFSLYSLPLFGKSWGVKWYISWEAGFIFKRTEEDSCMVFRPHCVFVKHSYVYLFPYTVVKRGNLLLQMRQRCIGWGIVLYIFTIYTFTIYHILSYVEYVQDIKSVSHGIWNQYPWIDLLSLLHNVILISTSCLLQLLHSPCHLVFEVNHELRKVWFHPAWGNSL